MITVTDYGDELTPALLKKIFEVSIVKRVVKAMGGKLEARSTERETSFSVTVPCQRNH